MGFHVQNNNPSVCRDGVEPDDRRQSCQGIISLFLNQENTHLKSMSAPACACGAGGKFQTIQYSN